MSDHDETKCGFNCNNSGGRSPEEVDAVEDVLCGAAPDRVSSEAWSTLGGHHPRCPAGETFADCQCETHTWDEKTFRWVPKQRAADAPEKAELNARRSVDKSPYEPCPRTLEFAAMECEDWAAAVERHDDPSPAFVELREVAKMLRAVAAKRGSAEATADVGFHDLAKRFLKRHTTIGVDDLWWFASTVIEEGLLDVPRRERATDPYRVAKAFSVAEAAVGWWEDHEREDCHFCKPTEDGAHDLGCPVGGYLRACSPAAVPGACAHPLNRRAYPPDSECGVCGATERDGIWSKTEAP